MIMKCTQQAFVSPQGRELVEHGTPLFPVGFYYDDILYNPVPWHWHDEMEAVVVEKGSAIVCAGTERYTLHAGQGFFVNAGVLHACWDNGAAECTFHSVVFHPRLVGGGIDSIFWQNYLRPLIANRRMKSVALDRSAEWHEIALQSIDTAWYGGAEQPAGYEFQVRAALSQLILQLSSHLPERTQRISEKAQRDGERIKQMLRYVEEHYSEALSTSEIAASAMISESECLRCFRSTIGVPPIQYVKQFRVQRAAELLSSTDGRIAEIGAQCGFQDTSYFTKTFRELKGITPREYRRQRAE